MKFWPFNHRRRLSVSDQQIIRCAIETAARKFVTRGMWKSCLTLFVLPGKYQEELMGMVRAELPCKISVNDDNIREIAETMMEKP